MIIYYFRSFWCISIYSNRISTGFQTVCRTKKCDSTSRIVTMHSHHIIADVRKLFWADKLFFRHCGLNDSLVWTPAQNVQGYPNVSHIMSHMAFQQHTTPHQQRQTYLEVQEAQK